MERREVIPAKDGLSVFVTGVGGCGKTTFIQDLTGPPMEAGFDIFRNKLVIRDLIKSYGFNPPSMVVTAPTEDGPSFPKISFLRELIQWQLILTNLHTQNMKYVKPQRRQALVLDRCALDSLIYFVYDIVNWSNEMTSISKIKAQSMDGGPSGDSARVLDDFILGRASGMVLHLITTAVGQVLKRRSHEEVGIKTPSWLFAVESNVYEILKGPRTDGEFEELITHDVSVAGLKWAALDFKEHICKPIAYILTSYIELIIDTPAVYTILTHNPHQDEIEKDDVRMTDMGMVRDLDNVTDYVLMGLFVNLKKHEGLFDEKATSFEQDFMQMIEDKSIEFKIVRPEGGLIMVAKEAAHKGSRYADVERDTKMRVKWAAELAMDYMRG